MSQKLIIESVDKNSFFKGSTSIPVTKCENKGLKMLPINRLDKFLFICLYNFANSFKLYIYILAIYITINIYFGINDGQIAIAFVLCFMMLILLAIDLNDKLKTRV